MCWANRIPVITMCSNRVMFYPVPRRILQTILLIVTLIRQYRHVDIVKIIVAILFIRYCLLSARMCHSWCKIGFISGLKLLLASDACSDKNSYSHENDRIKLTEF